MYKYFFILIFLSSLLSAHTDSCENSLAGANKEPITVVNYVNIITGKISYNPIDLVIPGPTPIIIDRYYSDNTECCCTDPSYSFFFCMNWDRSHKSHLVYDPEKFCLALTEGQWSSLILSHDVKRSFTLSSRMLHAGLTNLQGELSARTHPTNIKADFSENRYRVKTGSGEERFYKKEPIKFHFLIDKALLPNAYRFQYSYDAKDKMTAIHCISPNEEKISHASFAYAKKIKQDYMGYKDRPSEIIEGSNGQKVIYEFAHDQWGRRLVSVDHPTGPKERYSYNLYFNSLMSIIRPDNRYVHFQYYHAGENKVNGATISLSNADTRVGRIRYVEGPYGITHRFYYHLNTPKYKLGLRSGTTGVIDALGNKTDYVHDNWERLTHIVKYWGNTPCSTECLVWENENDLKTRALYDSENRRLLAHTYTYDNAHNVTEDRLYGNLTGRNVEDPAREYYAKTFLYSNDKFHVPLQEDDGRKQTHYFYKKGTDLLEKKLIYENAKIILRTFYEYDVNHILVKETTDDGSSLEKNNLAAVTERHIKTIFPHVGKPFGLPHLVAKAYVDLSTGQENLLSIEDYGYSIQGFILHERHSGAGIERGGILRSFDSQGNVTSETDFLGRVTERRYDENNNLIYEQGPNPDYYTEFTYDFCNRLIKTEQVHLNGQRWTTRHQYNVMGQKIATEDMYGNVTRFNYDPLGNISEIIHPAVEDANGHIVQPIESMAYDVMGNLIIKRDPLGNVKHYSYNARGQIIETIYPDGTIEKREYTLEGWLEKEISPTGLTTKYTHDCLGRVIATDTYSNGILLAHASSTYNAFHLLSETDAMGITTHYRYDHAGRLTSVSKEDALTEFQYDAFGRIYKKLEHTGSGIRIHITLYDALDRIIEERQEDETGKVIRKITHTYDIDGHRNSTSLFTDDGVSITKTIYDLHGRPLVATDALEQTTHYQYNDSLHSCEITDPLGRRTIQIFDALGRITEVSQLDPFGQELHHQKTYYDLVGNPVRIVESEITTLLEYDSMRHLFSKTEAAGTAEQKTVRYTYNSQGLRTAIHKPNGITLYSEYDAWNRLSRYYSSDNTIDYNYTYDLNHNLLAVKDINSETHLHYDSQNRLTQETLANGLTIKTSYDRIGRPIHREFPQANSVRYEYDSSYLRTIQRKDYSHNYTSYDLSGRLKEISSPAGITTFTYDALQRLTTLKAPGYQGQYTYDAVSNLIQAQGDCPADYSYNHLDQLIQENGQFSYAYQCDSLHNRLSKNGTTHSYNALHQLLQEGDSQYTYDANGNLISFTTPSGQTTLHYDALDRLVKVITPQDTVEYSYDPFNRRIAKKSNGEITHFLYQGNAEIGLYTSQGQCKELRILGIGKSEDISATIAIEIEDKVYFPAHDSTGNIVALLDSSGNTLQTYQYSAFGEEIADQPISPWRFSSKRTDPETGFIYFGQRYYMPSLGRWITQDPLEDVDGPNLYAYLYHSPLVYFDAYGCNAEEQEPGFWGSAWNSISSSVQWGCDRTAYYGEKGFEYVKESPTMAFDASVGFVSSFIDPISTLTESGEEKAAKSPARRWGDEKGLIYFGASLFYGVGEEILAARAAYATIRAAYTACRGAIITSRVAKTSRVALPIIRSVSPQLAKAETIATALIESTVAIQGTQKIAQSGSTLANELKFTKTAMEHMADPKRYVPRYILAEAIQNGSKMNDPRNAIGAIKIVEKMFRKNKEYNLNIIYREKDNTILHFHYD